MGGARCDDVTWGGPGAVASSGRWRRRAMGAEEPDVYRDTWVRYLGYANEVGESFRPSAGKRVGRGRKGKVQVEDTVLPFRALN